MASHLKFLVDGVMVLRYVTFLNNDTPPGPLPVWAIFPSPMQGLLRQVQWLLNKATQDSNRLRD